MTSSASPAGLATSAALTQRLRTLTERLERSVPDIDQGRLEAIQWIAFACMATDHIAVFFFHAATWMRVVGRFAFPLFALVFAWRLADAFIRNPRRGMLPTAHRLAIAGLWAQAFFWLMTNGLNEFNVMGTFLLASTVIALSLRDRNVFGFAWPVRVALSAVAIGVAGRHVEFGLPGVALLIGLFGYFRWHSAASLLIVLASLCAVAVRNTSLAQVGATLLSAPVAIALIYWKATPLRVVKPWGNAFYWLYPLHLLTILIILNWIYW